MLYLRKTVALSEKQISDIKSLLGNHEDFSLKRPKAIFNARDPIALSKGVYQQIAQFIKTYHQISLEPDFRQYVDHERGVKTYYPPNHSILTTYDFFVTDNEPRLIEINAGGDGFFTGSVMQAIYRRDRGIDTGDFTFDGFLKKTVNMFESEWAGNRQMQNLLMVGEELDGGDIEIFNAIFSQRPYRILTVPPRSLELGKSGLTFMGHQLDMIYFYQASAHLQQYTHIQRAYENQWVCLTPTPAAMFLYQRKGNQILMLKYALRHSDLLGQQSQIIAETMLDGDFLSKENAPYYWENRDDFLFKVEDSSGGQEIFWGSRLSRDEFDRKILGMNRRFIVQKKWRTLKHPLDKGDLGYVELRFFTYQGEIISFFAKVFPQGSISTAKIFPLVFN